MNMFYEAIGVLAGVLVMSASLPQLIQTLKTKNVEGLSFYTFFVWAMGALCWCVYGYYLQSYQMIIFNIISFLSSVMIMWLIKKHKK
ncbi:MAG: SemiSWEET family transporter [Alphaproteobacteria bacterium]|nr:SemiSWEET family transporter [Alphaproteobacteria bacterium]